MAEYDVQLTEKESEFCRLLVYDRLPQYKAYMEAFGASKATAPSEASHLVRKERVQDELKRLRDMKSQDAEWEFMDSVDALKGIVRMPENQTVQVNALKELNKMFGWDKSTVNHVSEDGSMSPAAHIDASKLSDAALQELMRVRSTDSDSE